MSEPERIWRFPFLVGGPSNGQPVHEAAWTQPSPKGLVTVSWGGRHMGELEQIPVNTTLDVNEYHAVFVNVGGRRPVEAFLHDQIAYSSKGIDALETAILDRACAA